MDIPAYLNFCPPDSPFFDHPNRDQGRFPQADASVPDGWRRATDPDWINIVPPGPQPSQGWKVHVSATPDNAGDVLEICWDYCIGSQIMFKFLRSTESLLVRSSKYGDRTASGKFVTIYPRDETTLKQVLDELGPRLDGFTGPSILSDLRWRAGPLYVRYGGFTSRTMRTENGESVLAIEDSDGNLVPDERRPGFHVPEWVTMPAFLDEAMRARNAGRLTDFPYRPTQALHFSNGGGVYRGVDAEGNSVVLKEARPLAGLDGQRADAVTRLERERWALAELAELPEIPRLIDYRKGHEHYFLVREDVDGVPLNIKAAEINPLQRAGATDAELRAYTEWALAMLDRIERGVSEIHRLGLAYHDLHPGNILVGPDDSLAFIDFEAARRVGENVEQALGAPGYMAPPGLQSADIDRYALGIIALDIFVPLAEVVPWGPDKIDEVLGMVLRTFPVPSDYEARVRTLLAPSIEEPDTGEKDRTQRMPGIVPVTEEHWRPGTSDDPEGSALAGRVAAGIIGHATPDRRDRLYPGDPMQFQTPTGGIGFLHGAAGVLWALHRSGAAVPGEHVEWLRRAVDDARWERCGFADGLGGVALSLYEIGEVELSRNLMSRAFELGEQSNPGRLADGLAGLGLCALTIAGGDESLVRNAERLVPRVEAWEPDERDRRWGPGVLGGTSGVALFFIRLYETTGDEDLLKRADQTMRAELAGWGWKAGDPQLPVPLARSPHLRLGGGTALVLHELLRHRDDPELARVLEQCRTTFAVPFATGAGLLDGRAGLMAVQAGIGADETVIEQHARDLRVHCVLLDEHPVMTGQRALRASSDVGTGSAGLLLALGALRGEVALPFASPAAVSDERRGNA